MTLLRCQWCDRTFLPTRLRVHESSCDARKHGARIERSPAATTGVDTAHGRAADDYAPPSPWRQHHQELQKAMATGRKGGAPSARKGGPPRSAGSLQKRPPGGRAGLSLSGESWGLGCGGGSGSDPTRAGVAARAAARAATLDANGAAAAQCDGRGANGVQGVNGARDAGFAIAPPRRMTAAQRHAREWAREQEDERAQPVVSRRAPPPPRAPPSALELRRSAALFGSASPAPPLQSPLAQTHGHFARASSACGAFASAGGGTASTLPGTTDSLRAGRANGYWPGASGGARGGR